MAQSVATRPVAAKTGRRHALQLGGRCARCTDLRRELTEAIRARRFAKAGRVAARGAALLARAAVRP